MQAMLFESRIIIRRFSVIVQHVITIIYRFDDKKTQRDEDNRRECVVLHFVPETYLGFRRKNWFSSIHIKLINATAFNQHKTPQLNGRTDGYQFFIFYPFIFFTTPYSFLFSLLCFILSTQCCLCVLIPIVNVMHHFRSVNCEYGTILRAWLVTIIVLLCVG